MPFELVEQVVTKKDASVWARERELKTKIFERHNTIVFRVRPKMQKLVEDALEHLRPVGMNFDIENDLKWYECWFEKVQVF